MEVRMYTLFLIGIAVAILLGFLFAVSAVAAITYGIVIFVYGPVLRAVNKTYDAVTASTIHLALVATPIIISWLFLYELWVIPLGITIGLMYGYKKLE